MILSDLRTEAVVVVVAPTRERQSSWGFGLAYGESRVRVCLSCCMDPRRAHEAEEVGKRNLRAGGRRNRRKACVGKRDDLTKFACVPRQFVFTSPFAF